MKPVIQWIHVEYGTSRTTGFRKRQSFIKRALGISVQTIVVQNDARVPLIGSDFIRGSNRLREFSAWDEGIIESCERGINPDWWIFSNDTFSHHRFFWGAVLAGFARAYRECQNITTPTIIGDILPGRLITESSGRGCYVSTYFFMVNSAALDRLENNLTQGAPLHWVAATGDNRVVGCGCPDDVKTFLHEHLCDPNSPRAWRSASRITAVNKELLRFKAMAILLEHAMSHRALQAGVTLKPIIDRNSVNFLRLIRSIEARLSRLKNSIMRKVSHSTHWLDRFRRSAATRV